MHIRVVVVIVAMVLAGIARSADATPWLSIVEPGPDGLLSFEHMAFDAPSATQRIRIRNDGSFVGHSEAYASAPFTIVSTSGSLEAGEEMTWEIACTPTDPIDGANVGFFTFEWCGATCEDDGYESITLDCRGGLLDTPEHFLYMPFAYAHEPSQQVITFTNPGPSSITVTELGTSDTAFTGELASGTLPVTLAAGEHLDVLASFDTTGPDKTGVLDVLAGTTVAGRVALEGLTYRQIEPYHWDLYTVPQGVTYTIPIAVRNSFPTARTITAATSNDAGFAVTGVVGTTLAPGERAHGLLTFTATTLGARVADIAFAFDTGQGDTGQYWVEVIAPQYAVTTADATTSDGRLDFGTLEVGAGPVERTITITNLDGVAREVVSCDALLAPFELLGGCPATIPPNGSFSLTVRFTPGDADDVLTALSVSLHDPDLSYVVVALSARVVPSQLLPLPGVGLTPDDEPVPDDDDGGCSAGGSAGGIAIAVLALGRRRRRR